MKIFQKTRFSRSFLSHFQLNASRPVMVYIHGGGFVNNNADLYPPNYLMERDIILVVIQFRLGILGNFYQNSFVESSFEKKLQ